MLNEALLAIGPVPIAAGILLLLAAAVYTHRLPSSKSATAGKLKLDPETLQIPQSISPKIPYIGHVLGFVKDGHRATSALSGFSARTPLPVFTIRMAKVKNSLWGGDNGPFSDPEFVEHLRKFLMNMKRLKAPFNFMIDEKLLTSRRFVRERLEEFSFEEYAEKCAGGSTDTVKETFLGRVRELCLTYGAATEGWTEYQLLLIAGLGPNVMAASTWMFHHLIADPALLTEVRSELDQFFKQSEGSIDVANISEACPIVLATWYEVLRTHGGFSLGRYVHEDTTLDGKYLLKKGTYTLAPLRPHHQDRQMWGPAADQFLPERFLKEDGSLDELQRRKLRVYGVFGTLCPGRYLAVHMAMALTVRLLLAFDMTPLNGSHTPPPGSKDMIAGLATPALDVEVVMWKLENAPKGLEISFKSNR